MSDINVGAISEALNNKADRDINNLTATGYAKGSGLGMPSSRYTNLTSGASGTTYTAPANGYFGLISHTSGSTSTWVGSVSILDANGITLGRFTLSSYNYSNGGAFIPVGKDMKIQLEYQNTVIIDSVKFIYAEGEQ